MLVDDRELEVVVPEAPRPGRAGTPEASAQQTPTGSHSCISRRTHSASSGSMGTSRARSSMVRSGVFSPFSRSMPLRSRKPLSSRLPRTSSAKLLLLVGEVAELHLPAQVIDERRALGEVLLDRRELFEAAAVARQGLLKRAVLEELLPVDLLDPLLVGPLLQVATRRPSPRPWPANRGRGGSLMASAVLGVAVRAGPRIDLLVGEHRVGIELLADLVDELEARELEQADRLLQLRRHDELLTELELLLYLHLGLELGLEKRPLVGGATPLTRLSRSGLARALRGPRWCGAASAGCVARPWHSSHTTNTGACRWQPGSGDFWRFSCQRLNLLVFG